MENKECTHGYKTAPVNHARLDSHKARSTWQRLDMMRITEIVSGHTRITIPEMKGKRQKREITNARQVAMYFAFQNKMGSLAFIGKFFNRDHATVLHAVRVVNNYIVTGDPIKDTVERCRVEIDKRMSR